MIDIIIPVYRAKKTLDRCLSSIVMQTGCDVSVTLVNDHPSEEDYRDFVERYSPMMKIVEIQMNPIGIGGARQMGVDNTSSELFCFMDADDTLVSSNALAELEALMDDDVVVGIGSFEELRPDSKPVIHRGDMIWMFGKMYRRSFWRENKITFIPSSCSNEDTGVNAMISLLLDDTHRSATTDTIVYQWHFNIESLTRQNDCSYTYDQNVTGYAENMVRAIHHVLTVDPGNPHVSRRVMYDICNLYKMHLETVARAPQYTRRSWSAAKYFYDSCFPQDGIPFDVLREEYDKVMYGDEFPMRGIIPHITLMDFIASLACSE